MPKLEQSFSNFFKLPNPGLKGYFEHVRNGNEEEYRTTFYKGIQLSKILENWNEELVTIQKEWPSLYQFESDLREKVGPLSIMAPLKDRLTDIDAYYDSISLNQTPVSQEAIDATLREWRQVAGLQIRSENRTVQLMKKSTNSGSPYFTKRRTVLDKTIPCDIKSHGSEIIQYLNGATYNGCAVLGWRGQEGGPEWEDVKQRVIWMFPLAVNIAELQVYQPLIESFQRFDLVPAWVSMESVDRRVTRLFDTKGDNEIICTDFSKFDQHFNHTCQLVAQKILYEIFKSDKNILDWLKNVFPVKYNIPLAYDWDKVRYGKHGMGSGSGGTNADETLLHRTLQHESALAQGKVLNPNSQCLGDDGILSFPGCSVEDVVRTYSSHGLEMNLDKQYVSKHDCTYLRRWHHNKYRKDGICVGVYATMRALGRLCEQERYYDPEVWGPKAIALRQLSILENVKYHPLNERFVDFCMKGDKFRLGLDIPGFMNNLEKEAQRLIDYMPDFLGYTKSLQHEGRKFAGSGIENWWIVQYLKSLK
jgi:hypothetical protein